MERGRVTLERIAFDAATVASLLGCTERRVRAKLLRRDLAHVAVGARLIVLNGDVFETDPENDGRATLRRAWRGRRSVPVVEVAEALGISVRSLVRLAEAGKFPLQVARGRWLADRDRLVCWLLARRRPGRAEIGR
jgi:hypothetical protein